MCDSPGRFDGWLEALPVSIKLPVTTFSEEDLRACGDAYVIEDALSVRGMFQNAYEVGHTPLSVMLLLPA